MIECGGIAPGDCNGNGHEPPLLQHIHHFRGVPFDHPDWFFEPKYDGFRGLLSLTPTVEADGKALFEAAQRLDLEGIIAKRKADRYEPGVIWYKIKNRAYTQMEGRGDLFHSPR